MSDLLNALSTLKDNGLEDSAIRAVINDLFEADAFDDDDDIKLLVVCADRIDNGNGFTADISATTYDDCTFDVDGEQWSVYDDDERESAWDDRLESYLDEGCVEGADSHYFDRERWKRDARIDGAGHTLSGYDGNENEQSTGNAGSGWYYLYRQN